MRIAIWGAGKMGQVHGNAYRKMGGDVEIGYVIERDREKARAFAKGFNCIWIETIEELERGSVDAVDICLPTHLHPDAVIKSLGSSDAVFCEKPLCLERETYERLKKAVGTGPGTVMIGQVLRFWNGYVKAKELLDKGAVGAPRMIACSRRQKMPAWSDGNWLIDSAKSGGLLMDLCIHDVDYVYWLLGRPKRVSCEIVKRETVTLHGMVTLAYEGCCAAITGSWGMPESFNGGELAAVLEIVGDQGMITYRGGDTLELIGEKGRETVRLGARDGYEEELGYFVQCVRDRVTPARSDILSVEGTMEILWAAEQAWRTSRAVELEGPGRSDGCSQESRRAASDRMAAAERAAGSK